MDVLALGSTRNRGRIADMKYVAVSSEPLCSLIGFFARGPRAFAASDPVASDREYGPSVCADVQSASVAIRAIVI